MDSFFYNLRSSKDAELYARTNQGIFTNEDDLKSQYALHWIYMAITRSIDTLYIKLAVPTNEFSKEIIEIAKNCDAEILCDAPIEDNSYDDLPF